MIGLMLVVSVNYIEKELIVRIRKITSTSAYDV